MCDDCQVVPLYISTNSAAPRLEFTDAPEKKEAARVAELKNLIGLKEGFLRPLIQRLVQKPLDSEAVRGECPSGAR